MSCVESKADYSAERNAFDHAKARCNNPENYNFNYYGARGIKFLFTTFEEFINSVGPRPNPKHSLDRIDNDGNYQSGNVLWATKEEQARNRRQRPNRTGFQCVYETPQGNFWTALQVDRKRITFPVQPSALQAAMVHDAESLLRLGPGSQLSLPKGLQPKLIAGQIEWPTPEAEMLWRAMGGNKSQRPGGLHNYADDEQDIRQQSLAA